METYAYLELVDHDGSPHVRALLCDVLPVAVEGFRVLGFTGVEEHVISDYFEAEVADLPGYYHLTIDEGMFIDAERLDGEEVISPQRDQGPTGLQLAGAPMEFTRRRDLPDGALTQAWRDRLLQRNVQFVKCRHASAKQGLLLWKSLPSYREWVDENKARDEARAKEVERHLIERGNAFINPYTFVPLPDGVQRDGPHGHAAASRGCLTGHVDVTFALQTPMMLPSDWHQDANTLPAQQVSVPGSSVRGAVRSLYEVMTESCLSIVDPEYVPVHRANFESHPGDRLAVVAEVKDGTPTHVQQTGQVAWVPALWLHELWEGERGCHEMRSGVRISLDDDAVEPRSFGQGVIRQELTARGKESLRLGGDWVVHVADAGTKGKHPAENVYVAVGKLQGDPIPLAKDAWDRYRELCRYSNDVEKGTFGADAPRWDHRDWPGATVTHKNRDSRLETTIGRRRKSDGTLNLGDSIWIRTGFADGRQVADGLKMASSWRVFGAHPIKERLPDSERGEKGEWTSTLLPCIDPTDLCPTCATFGFIEPRHPGSKENTSAEQNAYASHIKFGEFTTTETVELRKVHPPPLRSPRPSAGNFYLAHPDAKGQYREYGTAAVGNSSARWGAADRPVRKLAGRKFYWHGQESDQTTPTPRHIRRSHYPALNTEKEQRWLVPAGAKIQGRVYFENIDRTALAYLLTALAPARLTLLTAAAQPSGEIATHLGGGKSLGFGSATVKIEALVAEDARSRYSVDAQDAVDQDELLASLPPVSEEANWLPGLLRVLDSASVPVSRLWYPTMGNFHHRDGDANAKAFDESHKYYANFSGASNPSKAPGLQRMRTLPSVDEPNQFMSNEFSDGGH